MSPTLRHRLVTLSACAAVAAVVLWPLSGLTWFEQHEGTRYFIRLVALARNLVAQGGHPTWIPELAGGHGYPLFGFYSPGALYLALPFLWLGPVAALKCVLFLATTLGAFGLYLLGERLHGPAGGVIVAALGVTAPYALSDLFVRGDIAEYVAYFAAAWLLLVAVRTADRGARTADLALLAIGYGLFIPLHTVSALLYSGVLAGLLVAMTIAQRQDPRALLRYGAAIVLGLVIAAWYWLPALAERGEVHQEVLREGYFDFHRSFLTDPVFAPRRATEAPMYLGWPLLLGAALGLAASWVRKERRAETWALLALGAVLTVLTTAVTRPVWETVPLLSYTQFPWRLLGPASLVLACAAGHIARVLPPFPGRRLGMAAPVALVFAFSMTPDSRLLIPLPVERADLDLDHMAQTRLEMVGYGEYAPRSMPLDAPPPPGEPLATFRDGQPSEVTAAARTGVTFEATVHSPMGGELTLSQLDFPGWTVGVDGTPVPHTHDEKGRIVITVPEGSRRVVWRFTDTPVRTASKVLTLVGLLVVALLLALLLPRRPTRDRR